MQTQDMDRLRQLARSPYDIMRCSSVKAIGHLKDKDSVSLLIEMLQDEDEDVRCDVITALGDIGNTEAIPALIESLQYDPSGDSKQAVVDALVKLDAREAIPFFLKLVTHRDETLAWDDEELVDGGWDDWLDIQIKAIETLGHWGIEDAAIEISIALNDVEGQDISSVSTKALSSMGKPGFTVLERLLQDGSSRQRRNTAAAIVSMPQSDDMPLIDDLLSHENDFIRFASVQALINRNPNHEKIVSHTQDPSSEIRKLVIEKANLDDQYLIAALLEDSHSEVRLMAVEKLSSGSVLNDDDPLSRLFLHRVEQDVPDVAAACLLALARRCPKKARNMVKEVLFDDRQNVTLKWAAVRSLRNFDFRNMEITLQKVLQDDEISIRQEALVGISEKAKKDDTKALNLLLKALAPSISEIKSQDSLNTIDLEDNQEAITNIEKSGLNVSENSDAGSTSTLGSILGDEERARDTVVEAVHDETLELNKDELEMLAQTQRLPKKKVVSFDLNDAEKNAEMRRFTATLLGDIPTIPSREALEMLLDDNDDSIKTAALHSLSRFAVAGTILSDDTLAKLPIMLTIPNADVKKHALRLIASAKVNTAAKAVKACLKEKDALVRADAVLAWVALGNECPLNFMDDESSTVRIAATKSLIINDSELVKDIVGSLITPTSIGREDVLAVISERAPDEVVSRLFTLLENKESQIQWPLAMTMLEGVVTKHMSSTADFVG